MPDIEDLGRPALKPVNLTLQGSGSHGALTWGVLDRLFADLLIPIWAISGTSAGRRDERRRSGGRLDAG
jgi:predicted acylesterase/phospholipase RssA